MTAKKVLITTISATAVFAAFFGVKTILAAPTCGTGGVCSVLTTDGSGNFGIGANSDSVSRLFIKDADTSTTKNGLKIVSSDGSTPVFVVRNDGLVTLASSTSFANAGLVFPDGSKQVVAFTGAASSISAGNVSAGSFGSNLGGGIYSFPAALAVGTTTLTGLPTNGLLVNGSVVIPSYETAANVLSFRQGAPDGTNVGIRAKAVTTASRNGLEFLGYNGFDFSINNGGRITMHINGQDASLPGNVGIATTTPSYPLTVAGTIYSSTGGFRFPDGTTQTTAASGSGGGDSSWTTSGTKVILATTTNYVGIGTTTPAYPLDVYGAVRVNNQRLYLGTATNGVINRNAASADLYFGETSDTGKYIFRSSGVTSFEGNMGIGTTAPVVKLHLSVDGATPASGLYPASDSFLASNNGNTAIRILTSENATAGATPGITLIRSRGTLTSPSVVQSGDTVGSIFGQAYDGATRQAAGTIRFEVDGTPGSGDMPGRIVFLTSPDGSSIPLERMRINNAGNVGIGTTNPLTKLHVAGSGMFATTDFAVGTTGSELLTGLGATTGNTYGLISVYNSGAASYGNLALQSAGGNVGIGTTAPAYPLVISSTNANPIFLGITASSTVPISLAIGRTAAEGRFAVAHASGAFATDAAAGDLVIRTETTTSSIRMQAGAGATVLQITSSTVTVGGGTGKINVGTIDPPYTINGEQYATYMPAMTGQKEETTGEISLICHSGLDSESRSANCSTSIDFGSQEKGSDLWLFSKTTNLKNNFAKMTVLLTPSFDGKVWYEKDAKNNVLKVFAIPATSYTLQNTSFSVSYRLTAPRFDADKWTNTRNEKDVPGLIINY